MKFSLPYKSSWAILVSWFRSRFTKNTLVSDVKPLNKLNGFDYPDILSQWISFKYPNEILIVLLNINVGAKNISFWPKVPKTEMIHFLKDVVVLRCKDQTQLNRLIENIPLEFAEAYGYHNGNLIAYNKEEL